MLISVNKDDDDAYEQQTLNNYLKPSRFIEVITQKLYSGVASAL